MEIGRRTYCVCACQKEIERERERKRGREKNNREITKNQMERSIDEGRGGGFKITGNVLYLKTRRCC